MKTFAIRVAEKWGQKHPASGDLRHLSAQNFSAKWFGAIPSFQPRQMG
jgi:hypothetical protein